ncbi:AAA family ATPase [Candidatus Albibeggiatoa sp. nov. NOAA]|uniref:AAA family ATPase n=1 Tax=Candidatus Albibeggiatoa sp. nov. NOAA TaxID=3162724 RepID=UPI0032FFDADA|nr:AAA family ATPase [Thiotrichaceae bacterium]
MFLKKVEITKYRHLENIEINFEKSQFPATFSIASVNGGGKSTILQFIFILLRCFRDENRKNFIKNLLGYTKKIKSKTKLASFVIEEMEQDYDLEFIIVPTQDEERDFHCFLDIKEVKEQLEKAKQQKKRDETILELKNELEARNRVTPLMRKKIEKMVGYGINDSWGGILAKFDNSNAQEREIYLNIKDSNNAEAYHELLDFIANKPPSSSIFSITTEEDTIRDVKELESIYSDVQEKVENLSDKLKDENTIYISQLANTQNVLLLKTNMPQNILNELPNKLFLNTPKSQAFLFLTLEEKARIFNNTHDLSMENSSSFISYDEAVESAKNNLEGFFTYDFASTDLISSAFDKAFERDKQEKLETGVYGKHYDNLTEELSHFLNHKEISFDGKTGEVYFKQTDTKEQLLPEELSHGELKRLGIYIWLKYIVEPDSIVLMDEIDIALHPKWQYQITKDLKKWSDNCQFLLATHSPQILSSTYYKNLVVLELSDGKVKAVQFNKPPIDRDINTIITEIMGAPDLPTDLLNKHQKYRKLVDEGRIDSEEAKELKREILEYESENSAFFQEINFDLELMQ